MGVFVYNVPHAAICSTGVRGGSVASDVARVVGMKGAVCGTATTCASPAPNNATGCGSKGAGLLEDNSAHLWSAIPSNTVCAMSTNVIPQLSERLGSAQGWTTSKGAGRSQLGCRDTGRPDWYGPGTSSQECLNQHLSPNAQFPSILFLHHLACFARLRSSLAAPPLPLAFPACPALLWAAWDRLVPSNSLVSASNLRLSRWECLGRLGLL